MVMKCNRHACLHRTNKERETWDAEARELARAWEHNTCATHLDVPVCSKKIVATGGAQCTVLMAPVNTHDCMQWNKIGEEGARDLARALVMHAVQPDCEFWSTGAWTSIEAQ